MYLEGLEMIGGLVVVVVFVKVLEHFGWLGAGYDVADNCNAASGTPGDATIVTATTGSITLSAGQTPQDCASRPKRQLVKSIRQ
ncbi:unnamed protein product [Arctogadus glacialis]